jgi:DNA-binding MarR family transcriptional regulator
MIRRPASGDGGDPLETLETELAVLARTLELMARRSDLYDDLDRAGYLILRALDDAGPRSITALASELGLDASTVTRQVGGMEARGLVERRIDPSDRRTSIVTPTRRGRARMLGVRRRRRERIAELLADWTTEERSTLGTLLGRLNDSLAAPATGRRPRGRPSG